MIKVKLFDIEWDTDGEDVELPSEVVVEVDGNYLVNILDDEELSDAAVDKVSDNIGWCILSANMERVFGVDPS